jgi:hypothetical protein
MVPREAARGRSFHHAGLYYLHDKNASTSERVAFTHTENIPTQDPEKALKWMAHTASHADDIKRRAGGKRNGDRCEKPVYSFSLSWHPEERPKKWDMIAAGRQALRVLGLQDHETVMVSHSDEPHAHLHLIVNLVHPETGKVNTLYRSRRQLSKWAEEYERGNGKIYCEQRVENNSKRAKGQKARYKEPELDQKAIITQLYKTTDSGEAFQAALAEHGFKIAEGKRIVLIDRDGKIHSLFRQIEGVKAKDIRARLSDLALPMIDEARGQQSGGKEKSKAQARQQDSGQAQEKPGDRKRKKAEPENAPSEMAKTRPAEHIVDRDAQDQAWQESIIDAGIAHSETNRSRKARKAPSPAPRRPDANKVQDRHLQELGAFYTKSHAARIRLNEQLDRQYGQDARSLKREIERLDKVLKTAGPVKLWWLQMTGDVPRNPEGELDAMRKSLENIEWRQAEALSALEMQIKAEAEAIEARQAQERQSPAPEPSPSETAAEFNRAADATPQDAPVISRDIGPALSRD